jgi:dihydrolipoamide dehydrogenase
VAVVGGADTGCQLASILRDFGAEVAIVELAPRLTPGRDLDVSHALTDAFTRRGMRVLTDTTCERVEPSGTEYELRYRQGGQHGSLRVDAIFSAVGWPGNVDALHLDAAGVASARSYVTVDEFLQTSAPHIYAAGDIDGQSMLVQSAIYEGTVAAENAVLGPHLRCTHAIVPSGSFTDPEYASVGLTEAQARERYECAVAIVRYDGLLRPVADGRTDGFCKLIVDARRHEIVGAHVLGEYAVEVIQLVAACMAGGLRVEQLAVMQLAYPTFANAVSAATRQITRELRLVPLIGPWSAAAPLFV